ncbi:alpha/beta fold hydrolase [Streptomyces ochraceiscleroticus]|uniref:Alpha/beta fold hydrolase n=1 Tax=Streptomyces ochraceiscleroticus TaxID=47761 RepID=A0ABW1MFS6_9ACTN|nr:alpha/beta hydrolase [Streptomyces ochraceiscleroticus]
MRNDTAPLSPHRPLPPLSATVTGSGPGIVLAHGATGSIDDNYARLLPALAAGHTVVAPDYPGSGRTPRAAGPLTLDGLTDAVVDGAVAAGLETFTLVGYSLGAAVAVRTATRYPQHVSGLVLTAGLAVPDRRTDLWLALWQRLLAQDDYTALALARTLSGWSPGRLRDLPHDDLDALLDPCPELVPDGSADQAALVRSLDVRADLPGIAVPTLVIATLHDQLVDPAHSRYLADHIPGAQYAELAAGHVPMHECPEEWERLITGFLAAHGL